MKKEIDGHVYLIINNITKQRYVGARKFPYTDLEDYSGSGFAIMDSIKKYGIKNFTKICIEEHITDYDYLNELEAFAIIELKSHKSYGGLNKYYGGGHIVELSEEHIKNISNAHIGKHLSEETKRKLSIHFKGKKLNLSEESRERIRAATRGKQTFLGKKHTEETKEKISKANSGINNGMYGKIPVNFGKKCDDSFCNKCRDKMTMKFIIVNTNKNEIYKPYSYAPFCTLLEISYKLLRKNINEVITESKLTRKTKFVMNSIGWVMYENQYAKDHNII